jgi:hypothetical protein
MRQFNSPEESRPTSGGRAADVVSLATSVAKEPKAWTDTPTQTQALRQKLI